MGIRKLAKNEDSEKVQDKSAQELFNEDTRVIMNDRNEGKYYGYRF